MKCDYCDKPAVISLCRLETNPRTSEVEHMLYKAFCWEDAVKKGVMVYEEPRADRPLTLIMEDVAKGTKITPKTQIPPPQLTVAVQPAPVQGETQPASSPQPKKLPAKNKPA
ncbi:MAG: hypothetical protein FJ358_04995 [Thaumarchaeota archaeon]|nr:hypothetical protein [Nitrososphaerota archaeon]